MNKGKVVELRISVREGDLEEVRAALEEFLSDIRVSSTQEESPYYGCVIQHEFKR
jgi:hypothetical protein